MQRRWCNNHNGLSYMSRRGEVDKPAKQLPSHGMYTVKACLHSCHQWSVFLAAAHVEIYSASLQIVDADSSNLQWFDSSLTESGLVPVVFSVCSYLSMCFSLPYKKQVCDSCQRPVGFGFFPLLIHQVVHSVLYKKMSLAVKPCW